MWGIWNQIDEDVFFINHQVFSRLKSIFNSYNRNSDDQGAKELQNQLHDGCPRFKGMLSKP